jgi:ribosome-binding protein aMBF1 (putative translation factor)
MKTSSIKNQFAQLYETLTPEEQDEQAAKLLMFRFLSIVEERMEERGMSRKELANKLGTSASYITQLFRGHKLANLNILAKMARVLDISYRVHEDDQYASHYDLDKLPVGDGKGV